MIRIIILLGFVFPTMLTAQKKVLGHQDYDRWNTLESIQISRDGQMAVWGENPEYYQGKPFPHLDRYRQVFLSLEVDWTRIPTDIKWLKPLFQTLNLI